MHSLPRLLRIAWTLTLVAVCVGELLPDHAAPIKMLAYLHIGDKIQHFTAYAALAFLPALHERMRVLVATALGLVLLGVLLEFCQTLSVGRFFDPGDMMANTAGVSIGLALGLPLRNATSRYCESGS